MDTKPKNLSQGFTIFETLIAIGIFSLVAFSIYFAYSNILNTIIISQFNLSALSVYDGEIEAVRNMPYQDVGIQGGTPPGKLLAEKTVTQGGAPFTVKTTVRNIDDPFDGTIGGSPNDLAPADYRLVELEVSCTGCGYAPFKMTTTVAPKNLESATNNGALFINVFDASGQAVSQANVSIVNNSVNPAINLNDVTNVNGSLQLVDIATSSAGYELTVSKSGYSSERTYPPGGVGNPNPVKPHATVAKQQVTNISFAIDRLSAVNFKTSDTLCLGVGNVDFQQTGSKLIGVDPNVLKYSASAVTDINGNKAISNLEWDNYNFQNLDADYDVSGMFTLTPLIVNPNSTYNFNWVMEPKQPLAALITVRNQTGQKINDAKVTLAKTGFSQDQLTGRRFISQTDWSFNQYASQSGRIETNIPAGQLTLMSVGGKYASMSQEWLISKTFDFGTATISFFNIEWLPAGQAPPTGPDSLKFQIAANNDNFTWNFIGPDGTPNTYYTLTNTVLNSLHNNNRYLRYKAYLITQDQNYTPILDFIKINFRSSCVPDGQTFFKGLASGIYTLTIEKIGYQILNDPNFSVTGNWQEYRATINP